MILHRVSFNQLVSDDASDLTGMTVSVAPHDAKPLLRKTRMPNKSFSANGSERNVERTAWLSSPVLPLRWLNVATGRHLSIKNTLPPERIYWRSTDFIVKLDSINIFISCYVEIVVCIFTYCAKVEFHEMLQRQTESSLFMEPFTTQLVYCLYSSCNIRDVFPTPQFTNAFW